MNVDTELRDYKNSLINIGDKILMAQRKNLLVERIYLGATEKSFVFSDYNFNKDKNKEYKEVSLWYDETKTIKLKVNKVTDIKSHNTVLYSPIRYFQKSSIFLLEKQSKDINQEIVRFLKTGL